MSYIKWIWMVCVCIWTLSVEIPIHAKEAVFQGANIKVEGFQRNTNIYDENRNTYSVCGQENAVTISRPEGIGSIYIEFDRIPKNWTITDPQSQITVTCGGNGYLHEYVDIAEVLKEIPGELTLKFPEGTSVADIYIFSEGTPPDWVQIWNPPHEETDLMLLSSHSDDEQLFFAGVLPYYAVERKMNVQVVYVVQHFEAGGVENHQRPHEQLDGLWKVGVRNYPIMSEFPDLYAESKDRETALKQMLAVYQKAGYIYEDFVEYFTECIRRCKPLVIVSHDPNGEYGHGTHVLCVEALKEALECAGQEEKFSESAKLYGTWNVEKTYLHLYEENPIIMDFDIPLESMGGKTAFQVTQEGFGCHKSQHWTWFYKWMYGTADRPIKKATDIVKYSPCYYGLYDSKVGIDSVGGDFMENVKSYEKRTLEAARKAEEERLAAEAAKAKEEEERLLREQKELETLKQKEMLEEKQRKEAVIKITVVSSIIVLFLGICLVWIWRKKRKSRYGIITMKEKKLTFKKFYVCYLIVLAVAVSAAVIYVNGLLQQYEDLRPEKKVQEGIDQLASEAKEADFWSKYSLPEIEVGEYEAHMDVQSKYLELLADENVSFTTKNGNHEEDELFYVVENGGVNLAEIKLKATGPSVTKLTILNMREWELVSANPIVETRDYTISVPGDFNVVVNDITLLPGDGEKGKESEITYTVSGVYLEPEFDITDKDGNKVNYVVKNNRVMAEFYDYSLTLPAMLKVTLNGEICQGQPAGNSRVHYDIRVLEKPELVISDYFGNTMNYEGGDEVPLTFMTITADSRYNVTVSGQPVPTEIVTTSANKAYEQFRDYVKDLPQVSVYEIAVLNRDVEVSVTDENGNPVILEPGKTTYDLTMERNTLKEVPQKVSSDIDVLDVAKKWSLFMSNDLAFAKVKQHLIADSYQYEVAVQYATGEDITFTSAHTLGNPAFTQEEVTNFVWITDDCFSVDISFVKHMILKTGTGVDDYMNDRFYFVKYDDTEDDIDNPTWKIASMKEIVNNE